MTLRDFRNRFTELLEAEGQERGEVNSLFRLLGEAYLGMSPVEMSLHLNKELSSEELKRMEEGLERLQRHEPIQYILGETEFYGLPFRVNRNVLIPRPETEELVEWILEDLKSAEIKEPRILDIGTGSGCIAISLAKNLPGARVSAVDVSEAALDTAKGNAVLNEVEVSFVKLDILTISELPHSYDIIVSNPPYVRELERSEMKANVLENEPETALFVKDENPLLFYNKITKLAHTGLAKNGRLYFEINQYLGEETEQLLKQADLETELRKDFLGNFRMLRGIKRNEDREA